MKGLHQRKGSPFGDDVPAGRSGIPGTIGTFRVYDSFFIEQEKTFGLIGDIEEGVVEPGNYISIECNSTFSIVSRVDLVREIKISGEDTAHLLLLINGVDSEAEFLYGLNIGNERVGVLMAPD